MMASGADANNLQVTLIEFMQLVIIEHPKLACTLIRCNLEVRNLYII